MKLLNKNIHVNMILTSVMFYWFLFTAFYLIGFFYILWRMWNGHDVIPSEVLGAYGYYKVEGWTGFRKRRKFLINKQILAKY